MHAGLHLFHVTGVLPIGGRTACVHISAVYVHSASAPAFFIQDVTVPLSWRLMKQRSSLAAVGLSKPSV
jgi:hypothetical protein